MDRPAGSNLSNDPGLDLRRLGASLRDIFQSSVVHLFYCQLKVRVRLEIMLVEAWTNKNGSDVGLC